MWWWPLLGPQGCLGAVPAAPWPSDPGVSLPVWGRAGGGADGGPGPGGPASGQGLVVQFIYSAAFSNYT